MKCSEKKTQFESLAELEQIEGNYYKVDLFVSFALFIFTVWVFFSEKNFGWTILLGILAILFFCRGIKNLKEKDSEVKRERIE